MRRGLRSDASRRAVARSFEAAHRVPGLPPLVAILENRQAAVVSKLSPEIIEIAPQEAIAVRGNVAVADLPEFFERAFHEVAEAAKASGVDIVGPPFGFYPETPTETVSVGAGFPVASRTEPHGNAHRFVSPGGRAVHAIHVGSYETMEQTYTELRSWMAERGLAPAAGMWECYLSDPDIERDPAMWRTRIVWPTT